MNSGAIIGGEIGDALFYALAGVAMLFVRYKKEVVRPTFVVFLRLFGGGVIAWNVARVIFILASLNYTKT